MSKIKRFDGTVNVEVDGVKYKINENGDVISDDGTIKFKKEVVDTFELITEDKTEPITDNIKVEIDGVIYSIDKDGNALDEQGQIKFTKTELDTFDEDKTSVDDGNDFDISEISKLSGINILDDTGKEVHFDFTIEDLAKRESMIKELGETEGFSKGFNKFLVENPDIADIINYKANYGTIEGYSNNIDYNKVEIKDDDEIANYQLIYTAEIQRGKTPAEAKRYSDFCKANKSLKEDANNALTYLKNSQNFKIENIKKQQEAQILAQIEQEEKYFGIRYDENKEIPLNIQGSIYDIVVSKGKLGNFTIPETGITINTSKGAKQLSRRDIFDYISRPVKEINGQIFTQAQLDEIERMSKPEEWILRCISNLNGGIEQLVRNTVTSQQTEIIKKLKIKKKVNTPPKDINNGDKKIIWR